MLAPLTDADPRKVGRYWLQGRLGAGGMGTVYLGFSEDGHPAAVKVIRPELVGDTDFRERFRREVSAARRVRGSFVAEVHDADVDADRPWMATEYVDGVSLATAVADRGRLSGSALVNLATGLADALVAIHTAGLVHRDLKPSNILLAWDGPKVIDFGIAHAVDTTEHTQTGHIIGTVAWMAPEQLRGERAGPAADVFSWAMCVVFAATGRHPFAADTPTASALRMLREEPDLSEIPDGLVPLTLRALDRDPGRRPTAVELVTGIVRNYVDSVDLADQVTRRVLVAPLPPPPPAVPAPQPAPAAGQVPERHGAVRRWQLALVTIAAGIALGITAGLVVAVALHVAPGDNRNPRGAAATAGGPVPGGGLIIPTVAGLWTSAPPVDPAGGAPPPPQGATDGQTTNALRPPAAEPAQPPPNAANVAQSSPREPVTPTQPEPVRTTDPPPPATTTAGSPPRPSATTTQPVPVRTTDPPPPATTTPAKPPPSSPPASSSRPSTGQGPTAQAVSSPIAVSTVAMSSRPQPTAARTSPLPAPGRSGARSTASGSAASGSAAPAGPVRLAGSGGPVGSRSGDPRHGARTVRCSAHELSGARRHLRLPIRVPMWVLRTVGWYTALHWPISLWPTGLVSLPGTSCAKLSPPTPLSPLTPATPWPASSDPVVLV